MSSGRASSVVFFQALGNDFDAAVMEVADVAGDTRDIAGEALDGGAEADALDAAGVEDAAGQARRWTWGTRGVRRWVAGSTIIATRLKEEEFTLRPGPGAPWWGVQRGNAPLPAEGRNRRGDV